MTAEQIREMATWARNAAEGCDAPSSTRHWYLRAELRELIAEIAEKQERTNELLLRIAIALERD